VTILIMCGIWLLMCPVVFRVDRQLRRVRLRGPECRHPRTVVVESIVTGEPLARLCTTCDRQLGA